MLRIPSVASVIFRSPLRPLSHAETLLRHPIPTGLLAWYESETMRQTLYLASPSLYQVLISWLATPTTLPPPAAQLALLKYSIRMSTRATPFGLFAGIGIVHLGHRTELIRSPGDNRTAHRLDGYALIQLYERLSEDVAVRARLRYQANNSLVYQGSEWHYSEFLRDQPFRPVQISAFPGNPLLDELLTYVRKPSTIEELHKFIADRIDAEPGEIADYIIELIDAGVLLANLEPNATGTPYDQRLADFLTLDDQTNPIRHVLLAARDHLTPFSTIGDLMRVDELLNQQGIQAENQQSLVHTNLYYESTRITIARQVAESIREQVTRVSGLFRRSQPGWYTQFKTRFLARYGTSSVPLLLALDNDMGLGLAPPDEFTPLNAPITEAVLASLSTTPLPISDSGPSHLLRQTLFERFQSTAERCLSLSTEDLLAFPADPPGSWAVLGSLLAASGEAVDAGDYHFLVRSVYGPSSAMLLGRFCLDSPALTAIVQQALQAEEATRPTALFAEIAHLTGGRSGNINARPILRTHEIPYLTPASVEPADVIELSDLMLHMPDEASLVVYSQQHQRVVIPRLTTAHNTTLGDDVYRFLAQVGLPDNALGGNWHWGQWETTPFLPQIRYDSLIMQPARWYFNEQATSGFASFNLAFSHFAEHYQLPDVFLLAGSGDNELRIDRRVAQLVTALELAFKRDKKLTLLAFLSDADHCCIRDEEGAKYTNELLISVTQDNVPALGELIDPSMAGPPDKPQRQVSASSLLPQEDSDWLFVKWYTGHHTAHHVLLHFLAPLVDALQADELISDWFFIRYYDPEFHLRIRFKVRRWPTDQQTQTSASNWNQLRQLVDQATQQMIDQGLVYEAAYDRYEPETERYGSTTLGYCEALFGYDSACVLDYLRGWDAPPPERDMLRFALQSSRQLLLDFGLTTDEQLNFYLRRQAAYWQEFGGGPASGQKPLKDRLNKLYREYAHDIENWLAQEVTKEPALLIRSEKNRPLCQAVTLALAQPKGCATTHPSLNGLMESVLHMALDRLFTARLRLNELIVYHFMARYTQSLKARQPQ